MFIERKKGKNKWQIYNIRKDMGMWEGKKKWRGERKKILREKTRKYLNRR